MERGRGALEYFDAENEADETSEGGKMVPSRAIVFGTAKRKAENRNDARRSRHVSRKRGYSLY